MERSQETVLGQRKMIELSGLYLERGSTISFLFLSLTLSASSVRDRGVAATFPTGQQQHSQNSLSKFRILIFPLLLGICSVHYYMPRAKWLFLVVTEDKISVYVATLVHVRGWFGADMIYLLEAWC